ncbi:condensation domain-containing protein [Nonomuraea spiralis]|uniref:condensation domain-containing protein n=1 Tax=Nonomuraea spiralis TaxID=46182 RepID=UPI0037BD0381
MSWGKATSGPTSFVEMARLAGNYTHWHNLVYSTAWLTGRLDHAALREAWRVLCLRHDVMRRAYVSPDEACTYEDVLTEVEFHSADTDDEALETMRRTLVGAPFSLDAIGLSRIVVVRRDDRRHLFGIALDHLITDLTSWNLLVAELGELYERAAAGERIGCETEGAASYQEFAALLRQEFAGRWGEERRAFWRAYTERFRSSSPPLPSAGAAKGEPAVKIVRRALPADAHSRVRQLARQARATPFVVVTAAILAGMKEATGASSVGVSVAHHGRALPYTAKTLGQFVQRVPLHLDGEPGGPLETVRDVFGRSLDVFDYALPLDIVERSWGLDLTSSIGGNGAHVTLDQSGEGFRGSPLAGTRAEPVQVPAPGGHGLVDPLIFAWWLDEVVPRVVVHYDESLITTEAVEAVVDVAARFAVSDGR